MNYTNYTMTKKKCQLKVKTKGDGLQCIPFGLFGYAEFYF